MPGGRRPLGQVVIALYAVFAVAAGARAGTQLLTRYDEAPAAYLLSLGAALVYLVATVALRIPGRRAFLVALAGCLVELVGVLGVGTLTLVRPGVFADETVWSGLGAGYFYVPLVLPVLGLAWLRHVARTDPGVRRA